MLPHEPPEIKLNYQNNHYLAIPSPEKNFFIH